MKKSFGFTLIELAIVLVIIGLLLLGVLKGQELINSAKVKNMASNFKNMQLLVYSYQDKYKSLPGDDANVASHLGATAVSCAPVAAEKCIIGNGIIDGAWDATAVTDESFVFWSQVRSAGLETGSTDTTAGNYLPRNANGGRMGVQSITDQFTSVTGMVGTFVVCSDSIVGKLAKQLDLTLDDGTGDTGSLRVVLNGTPSAGINLPDETTAYLVCMAF